MTIGDATPHELARATIFESDGFEREPAVIVARAFLALEAELQAAQEREKALRETLETVEPLIDAQFDGTVGVAEYVEKVRKLNVALDTIRAALGHPGAPLAAQRTEEPSDG